jgi:ubiquitin-like protein Pup
VAVYKEKSKSSAAESEVEPVEAKTVDTSETDDLLDEIDGVLEENAQAFVENYVQKGGE